jgi:hypothetical protein
MNFTKRSRLTREQANVAIHPDGERKAATFEAQLRLDALPSGVGQARVFVEAYHQTTRMRFDYGTVAAVSEPPLEDRRLSEFSDWKDVMFRVKITDVTDAPGRLLAWADRIKPKGPDDQDEPDLVRFRDAELFGRLWDVEFDESGPVVVVERAHGAQNVGRDDRFRAVAYPEIMRRTLEHAFIDEQMAYPQPGHWSTTWVRDFVLAKLGLKASPALGTEDTKAVREWINDAVELFARKHKMAELWGELADPAPTDEEAA